jgi:hypothetical protein
MKKHSLWFRLKRKLVFFFGDLRRIQCFPWITWDVHKKMVNYHEALKGIKKAKAGDIGLHRDKGYFSNLAIPGFLKHAWIHITDGTDLEHAEIVEAVSEGVLKRHALYPVMSDFAIILRPPNVDEKDIKRAVRFANKLVGCEYDVDFEFDIEQVHEKMAKVDDDAREGKEEFHTSRDNLKERYGSFSCTEVVSFCWWHRRRKLQIGREEYAGKEIIKPDSLIRGFQIVWASKQTTPEMARKYKVPEVIVQKLEDYWTKRKKV